MIVLLLAAVTSLLIQPHHQRPGSTSVGSPVVSPAVIASLFSSTDASGTPQIDLLVLWRGTPGWFMRGSGGSSGSSAGGSGGGGTRGGPVFHEIYEGGVKLTLQFDPEKRTVRIQERDIELRDDNVVLVDDVDSRTGPTIVGTRRIDPAFIAIRSDAS